MGHTRARCRDDQRVLTVNHGSAGTLDQRIRTSTSSQVGKYRSSKLVMRVRFPSPALAGRRIVRMLPDDGGLAVGHARAGSGTRRVTYPAATPARRSKDRGTRWSSRACGCLALDCGTACTGPDWPHAAGNVLPVAGGWHPARNWCHADQRVRPASWMASRSALSASHDCRPSHSGRGRARHSRRVRPIPGAT